MPNIQNTFSERSKWINTRSSTIFPIYLNKNNDQILVFQNYWKWKSKIKDLKFILTLRAQNSKTINQTKYSVKTHNEISIKKIFNLKNNFIGQLECEIASNKNLKFPYPALMMFYRNLNGFESVVHSAGRHLNFNEKISSKFNESNFKCFFDDDFTPIIHVFSGRKINNKSNSILLGFYDKKNKHIFSKNLNNLFKKPFSSKIIFLDKILSRIEKKKIYRKNFFIKIKFDIPDIFGRLIVGNYDKKNDALFMTHTFRVHCSKNKNLITPKNKFQSTAYLPLMNFAPLKMKAVSYPTNANILTSYNQYILKKSKKIKINSGFINTGGHKSEIFEIDQFDNNFKILEFKKSIPDRLNVEFNYSLENSRHPTDIADGIKTCYQPKKFSHWGHGVSRKSFTTYIFIANYSNLKRELKKEKIKLNIFSNYKQITKTINLESSSFQVVKFENLKEKIKSNYFSWKVFSKESNLNIYWVSFDKNGSICGDHAF